MNNRLIGLQLGLIKFSGKAQAAKAVMNLFGSGAKALARPSIAKNFQGIEAQAQKHFLEQGGRRAVNARKFDAFMKPYYEHGAQYAGGGNRAWNQQAKGLLQQAQQTFSPATATPALTGSSAGGKAGMIQRKVQQLRGNAALGGVKNPAQAGASAAGVGTPKTWTDATGKSFGQTTNSQGGVRWVDQTSGQAVGPTAYAPGTGGYKPTAPRGAVTPAATTATPATATPASTTATPATATPAANPSAAAPAPTAMGIWANRARGLGINAGIGLGGYAAGQALGSSE